MITSENKVLRPDLLFHFMEKPWLVHEVFIFLYFNYSISNMLSISLQGRVHVRACLLNHKSFGNETQPATRYSHGKTFLRNFIALFWELGPKLRLFLVYALSTINWNSVMMRWCFVFFTFLEVSTEMLENR